MTACPGSRERGVPAHDSTHVAVRLEIPWLPSLGVVKVLVIHRCDTYGCPQYCVEWAEPAREPEAVLRKVLASRGMLGCSHSNGKEPVTPMLSQEQVNGIADRYMEAAKHNTWPPTMEALRDARRPPTVSMEVLRDAPRPSLGQLTSDPDAFLDACRDSRRPVQ